ncbi:unnamed protein product [Trichobilharzia szidati]|nr:unnamed protein product [Trichobilharzia szidati]CAH8837836.1 unnamed protein product [Trichobilharzia szidati]
MWTAIHIVILLVLSGCITADVNITYVVRNYQNPYNLDSRLRKCEALNVFGDHCDPFFHFAAYTSTKKWEKRSTLRKEAGPFVNSKYVENVLEAYEIHQTFPEAIEIELDIQDSDIDDDQRIALFRRQVPLESKGKYEFRMGVDVKVEAYIDISCTKDYYGKRCEVYCIPMQDLWTCDEITGARVCSKPCLHGKCTLTSVSAICECTAEWHGEFCQTPIESKIISTILAPEIKAIHVAKPITIDQSVVVNTTKNQPNNDNKNEMATQSSLKTSTRPIKLQLDSRQADENDDDDARIETTEAPIQVLDMKVGNSQKNVSYQPINHSKSSSALLPSSSPSPSVSTTLKSSSVSSKMDTSKQSERIINPTGLFTNMETRNYMILAFIIIGLLLWLIGILVIGLICYRRRRNQKASVRKSALWTNISYEPSSYPTECLSSTEYFLPQHENENHHDTMKFSPNNNTFHHSLRRTSPKSALRNSSTLPRLPNNEHFVQRRSVRYTRPSNAMSRLRFGTISYTPVTSPSLSMYTQRSTLSPSESCLQTADTYEELTCCLNDHVNWKSNQETPKLTTFQ